MYEWTDPDTGTIYQIEYVVTMHPSEGPEFMRWRIKPDPSHPRHHKRNPAWWKLPPFVSAQDMKEIEEHFHGSIKPFDQETD